MQAKTGESPGIESKMDDVTEAVAALKRDLISELPKMRRASRTDVSDLVWIRVHRCVAVPFRTVRRRLLTALRIRSRSGHAFSETFPEVAHRRAS